ncbi:MAG: HEAT repeat domain-containing protein [Acidobacteriota bacterium]
MTSSLRRWTVVVLALTWLGLPCLAEAADSEKELRRRIKRFYVLSYLNRHGELWDMFDESLQERLGGDRKQYVKQSRRSGFELYSSVISEIERKGDKAIVDVALRVQLGPGASVTTRHHRMAWVLEDERWYYLGSLDITHRESEVDDLASLRPPSEAESAAIPESEELLPSRVEVAERTAPSPELEPSREREGVRWDLVGVAPKGAQRPDESTTTPMEVASAEPRETETAAAEPARPTVSEPAPSEPVTTTTPEAPRRAPEAPRLLPDEPPRIEVAMADRPAGEWLPPSVATARPVEQVDDVPTVDFATAELLVRRCIHGLPMRRHSHLKKLRAARGPEIGPAIALVLPEAPPQYAVYLIEELARRGATAHAGVLEPFLDESRYQVRLAAARALAKVGGVAQVEPLVRMARDENNAILREAALRALGAIGDGQAEDGLVTVLGDSTASSEVREAAAWAAGECGAASAVPSLVDLAGPSWPEELAGRALISLGVLGGDVAREHLERVASTLPRLRLPALKGLARLGRDGAGAELADALLVLEMEADSLDVDRVAATGEVEALASLLEHVKPTVRRRTLQLMGRVVDSPAQAASVLEELEDAFLLEGDDTTFGVLIETRERLKEMAGVGG